MEACEALKFILERFGEIILDFQLNNYITLIGQMRDSFDAVSGYGDFFCF
jgi:hypothetical protein